MALFDTGTVGGLAFSSARFAEENLMKPLRGRFVAAEAAGAEAEAKARAARRASILVLDLHAQRENLSSDLLSSCRF